MLHRERIFSEDGSVSKARLVELASETFGSATASVKLSFQDEDEDSVDICNSADLADIFLASCKHKRLCIRATLVDDEVDSKYSTPTEQEDTISVDGRKANIVRVRNKSLPATITFSLKGEGMCEKGRRHFLHRILP